MKLWNRICVCVSTALYHLLSVSQARAKRGWSTSASTSAFPATSACPCVSTTCRSDCVHSILLLPAKDQGNKVVFLALVLQERKKQNKNQLWLFPLCHPAASKPVKQPALSSPVSILPRERRWRQVVTVIAKAPSSPPSCLIPSLVAHLRDYRRKIPFFLYMPLIVFPVTYYCSVIMCNHSCRSVSVFDLSNKRLLGIFWSGNRNNSRTVRTCLYCGVSTFFFTLYNFEWRVSNEFFTDHTLVRSLVPTACPSTVTVNNGPSDTINMVSYKNTDWDLVLQLNLCKGHLKHHHVFSYGPIPVSIIAYLQVSCWRAIIMLKHKPPLSQDYNCRRTFTKSHWRRQTWSESHRLKSPYDPYATSAATFCCFISFLLLSPAHCHWRPDTPRPSGGRCIPSWSPRFPHTTDEPGCQRTLSRENTTFINEVRRYNGWVLMV